MSEIQLGRCDMKWIVAKLQNFMLELKKRMSDMKWWLKLKALFYVKSPKMYS